MIHRLIQDRSPKRAQRPASLFKTLVALEKAAVSGGSSAAVADNAPAVERK